MPFAYYRKFANDILVEEEVNIPYIMSETEEKAYKTI
jgi:hypothetical protein